MAVLATPLTVRLSSGERARIGVLSFGAPGSFREGSGKPPRARYVEGRNLKIHIDGRRPDGAARGLGGAVASMGRDKVTGVIVQQPAPSARLTPAVRLRYDARLAGYTSFDEPPDAAALWSHGLEQYNLSVAPLWRSSRWRRSPPMLTVAWSAVPSAGPGEGVVSCSNSGWSQDGGRRASALASCTSSRRTPDSRL